METQIYEMLAGIMLTCFHVTSIPTAILGHTDYYPCTTNEQDQG